MNDKPESQERILTSQEGKGWNTGGPVLRHEAGTKGSWNPGRGVGNSGRIVPPKSEPPGPK